MIQIVVYSKGVSDRGLNLEKNKKKQLPFPEIMCNNKYVNTL